MAAGELPRLAAKVAMASSGVALLFMACLAQPLLLIEASGDTLIGAELPVGAAYELLIAKWVRTAYAATKVFTIPPGAYVGGVALVAAPLSIETAPNAVCRTPAMRRARLAAGAPSPSPAARSDPTLSPVTRRGSA